MDSKLNCELSRLRRKLNTLEPTILHILSLKRYSSILNEKLKQLEDLVMTIPDECVYFATEWRGKLAQLYRIYSEIVADTDIKNLPQLEAKRANNLIQLPPSRSSFRQEMTPPLSPTPPPSPSCDVSSIESFQNDEMTCDLMKPSTSSKRITLNSNETTAVNSHDIDQSKQKQEQMVKSEPTTSSSNLNDNRNETIFLDCSGRDLVQIQIEEALDLLRPMSVINFDDLRKLAKLLNKSDLILHPYWRDRELQECLLNRFKEILPKKIWDNFESYVGKVELQSIRKLKRFIIKTMVDINEKMCADAEAELQQKCQNQGVDVDLYCNYCKEFTHLVVDCPQVKFTLCYTCFDNGHTQRRCPLYEHGIVQRSKNRRNRN
ncbi:hypothetical protein BLOT_014582 [Blomia tropicalis]|nr:hypothetical protein BLOT_014582 [Blomia tropicalis]